MEIKLHFQTKKTAKGLRFGFIQKIFLGLLLLMSCGVMGQTASYTVTSTSAVTPSGTVPSGSGATYSQTFGTAKQITANNSATLTLTGYAGHRILNIILEMRSNASAGAGTLSVLAGSTTIYSISPTAAFNTALWNGAYSSSYVDVSKVPTAYAIASGENVVVQIAATTNSLYIQKYTVVYEVVATCTNPTISFPSSTISRNVGDANYTHAATSTSPGAITYSSNNTSVATVNASTGEVTVGAAGTAIVTASQVASGTYCAATTSYTLTVVSTAPAMSTSGTVTALSTIYGTPSTSQNFTFTATNLTGSTVTATAPAGFEISSSSGGPFGATATFTVTGGSASGTVYVRLAQTTAAGTHSGTVTLTDTTNSASATKAIPNSTVNPKALTISGITAFNKVYDGNTSVVVTASPQYVGLENGETASVAGTVTWAFSTKNVGATVVRTGSYNPPNTNYTVTQPTASANITPKPIAVTGAAAQNKSYDGNTAATITGTLTGVISPDAVTLSGTGTFASPNVGTGIAVTSTSTLSGVDASNYTLTQPSGLSADITAVAPTFTTSAIGLSVGGSYSLPGTNVTSNSSGALTYALGTATPAGAITLTGNTLNGVAVGTATLTVTQYASGNYTAGSTTVTVNVTTVAYSHGDFRTLTAGTWTATSGAGTATWEKYSSGTGWNSVPGVSPTGTDVNVYITKDVQVPTSAGAYGGAKIIVSDNATLFFNSSSLWTFNNVIIESGSTVEFKTRFAISSLGEFEIKDGGNFIFNHSSNPINGLTLFNGKEKFSLNSNFIIKDLEAGNFLDSTLLDKITTNSQSSYFGNIIVDYANGTNNFILFTTGAQSNAAFSKTICNDLIFRTSNSSSPRIYQKATSFIGSANPLTIGGSLLIENTFNQSISFTTAIHSSGSFYLKINKDFIHNGNSSFYHLNSSTNNAAYYQLTVAGNFTIGDNAKYIYRTNIASTASIYVKLGGNLTVGLTGEVKDEGTNAFTTGSFWLEGTSLQSIDYKNQNSNQKVSYSVRSGSSAILIGQDLKLGNSSTFAVNANATLNFGFNASNAALNILGNGTTGTGFTSLSNSTLIITSPQGVMNTSGNVGNIQTNTAPSIDQTANFYYVGKENQVTGSGLTSTNSAKNVFVNLANNTLELRLTNPVQINSSGKLEIQKGIVLGEEATPNDKDFYGLGNLIMTDGEYRISTIAANPSADLMPQLSGTYTLTGGTVTLNGNNADQVIRNGRTYHNLKIAGTNTLLSNAKKVIVNSGVTVNSQLQITENAIFDSSAHVVGGTANVFMDGNSRWRNARTTTTQPELLGSYYLTGGTMEFYGTSAATSQTIKGISYYNLDINADAINSVYNPIDDFYNVSPASSISVAGNLNVNAPAAFKVASTHNISGDGNIFINPGATLLYGSPNGIKTTGTSPSDGAIRVGGTRSFSSDASYGFIGGQSAMVTGNALPATVENLYIAKSNATDDVTLSNPSLTARNKMYFLKGNIITGNNNFQLGTDAANKGTLQYNGGFVKGNMKRWFDGANSGDATSLFPLGTTDNKNRFAKIEFTNTTASGILTASVQDIAMGTTGISTLTAIPAVGTCASFLVINTSDFYWNLSSTNIAGNYTASFTKDQLAGESPCEVTILNRTAADWTTPGSHLQATSVSGLITATRSGLSAFSDFGFGNRKCGETKTWTGTWSGGTAPTITNKVVFAANYDSTTQGGNVSACECEIQTGVTVTIAGGATPHNMEIYGKLEGSGTLKLENNASLIQHDDASVNSGNLEMIRNTQPSFRFDYTYWSSPVVAQSLHAVSPTTFFDKYFSWDAGLQEWQLHQRPTPWNPLATPLPANMMTPGKGYIIRAPQNYPVEAAGVTPLVYVASFKGVPNNGMVSVPIVSGTGKYNLIGNPYPSAVSADAFLQNATNIGAVEGTIYFWTHNTPIAQSGGTGNYNYSAADYAVYNGVGATATVPGANSGGPNNNPNVPNGNIASGQSFFIKSSAAGGNATFSNSMRLKGNNNQFFRYAIAEALPQPELEKHRIWLNLSNETNGFSQSLVGYVENATNGYDRNFDGELLGGGSVSLYSLLDGNKMTIQGKTLPFDQNDQVPMGFKATAAGNLKVSLDHFDGLFSGQNIYLEDKALDIIHDLKAAPYTFTTAAGTFNERFVVRYTNESLGTGEHSMDANGVIVAVKDKVIKVISAKENIQSIAVFELLGRAIYDNNQVNALSFSTEEIAAQEQVLIVKIVLENNAKADRKIIFK